MNFRRMITVFAVLALFAGLASAQIQNQVMQCNATGAVPPVLRAEGITELTGDIILTCTGGAAIPQIGGAPGPGPAGFANFQVSLPTNVTSRQSEPLLMIDEPGSGLSGSPATQIASGAGQNVYPGTVAGNQVFFNAIPIVAPFTQGFTRVYRIVNVRANATTLPSGAFAGTSPVFAYVAISGSQSLSLPFSQLTVGYVAPGLGTSSGGTPIPFLQCQSGTTVGAGTITFKELFATAFKPRSVGNDLNPFSPTTTPDQNSPGKIYNTESGFYYASGGSTVGSVAGAGTRLRATFNNVPSGVRVFVGTAFVVNAGTPQAVTLAQLVPSDSGAYAAPSASTQEVTLTNGSGVVYYEWVAPTSYANTIDTITFPVTITYTGNQSANTPTAGQVATVSVSYAPISTVFTSSSTAPIPRFVDLNLAPTNLFVFNPCQTTLLFPFVTNQGGFDTGLAISNTSTDPGTGTSATPKQSGTCTLYFYSGGTAVPNFVTASIGTGTTYVNLASAVAANFQGYMIAVCNFQYAHGFAFISDIGARELAMGYLALVLNNGTQLYRSTSVAPNAEQLNN